MGSPAGGSGSSGYGFGPPNQPQREYVALASSKFMSTGLLKGSKV